MPQLNQIQWIIVFVALIVSLQLSGFLFAFRRWYRPCPPGKALIRTGLGAPRITTRGGLLIIPPLHKCAVLTLVPLVAKTVALRNRYQHGSWIAVPPIFLARAAAEQE